MKKLYSIILSALLMIVLGCKDDEIMAGDLTIETKKSSIVLKNNSNEDIFTIVLERNAIAYVDWIPTVSDDNALPAGESEEIQLEDIIGYDDEAEELIIYYWKVEISDGELVPGPVDSVIVPIN